MNKVIVHTQPKQDDKGISVDVYVQTALAFTAEDARRRVNRDVVPELGTGLGAGNPALQIDDEQIFWQVPIVLSLPNLGALGIIGVVLVDAQTGNITLADEARERLLTHARWLYTGALQDEKRLHLKDVNHFLSLRGSLADDEDFDRAMQELEKAWST